MEAKERDLAAKGKNTGSLLEKEGLVDEEGNEVEESFKARILDQEKEQAAKSKIPLRLKIDELDIAGVVQHPKDWSITFLKAKTQVPTTA